MNKIDFPKRCRTDETLASKRKIWVSHCGRYRVVFSRCRFGRRSGRYTIRDVFYAELRDDLGWDVISRHRNKHRAFGACRAHACQSLNCHPC